MDKQKAQKALDDEMRARIDSLALTTTPMRLLDMARLPKGVRFEIRWGEHSVPLLIKYFILVMFYKTLRLIRH